MTWHFQSADEEFAEVQAGDLQAHLVKVSAHGEPAVKSKGAPHNFAPPPTPHLPPTPMPPSMSHMLPPSPSRCPHPPSQVSGHSPVEVSLDMRRVEVRPYGVSKGAAIQTILDRIMAEDVAAMNSNSSPTGGDGADGGGGSSTETSSPGEPMTPAPTGSDEPSSSSTHPTLPSSSAHPPPDHDKDKAAAHPSPFKWVFCASEVLARDEDLFSSLQGLSDLPSPIYTDAGSHADAARGEDLAEAPRVFTCCVGKTLSQADFHIADLNEVAGLLDLLAHVSLDASTVESSSKEEENAQRLSDLPSTLERLHQLVKLVVGKQLLLLIDYDGCAQALASPSKDMARFLARYPTAVVQRASATLSETPEGLNRDGSSLFSGSSVGVTTAENLGSIAGVHIASFGPNEAARPPPRGARHVRSGSHDDRGSGSETEAGGAVEMVMNAAFDSYRPALESCFEVLQQRVGSLPQVAIEDNTFSLTVTHRGAEDHEAEAIRELVTSLLSDEYATPNRPPLSAPRLASTPSFTATFHPLPAPLATSRPPLRAPHHTRRLHLTPPTCHLRQVSDAPPRGGAHPSHRPPGPRVEPRAHGRVDRLSRRRERRGQARPPRRDARVPRRGPGIPSRRRDWRPRYPDHRRAGD